MINCDSIHRIQHKNECSSVNVDLILRLILILHFYIKIENNISSNLSHILCNSIMVCEVCPLDLIKGFEADTLNMFTNEQFLHCNTSARCGAIR